MPMNDSSTSMKSMKRKTLPSLDLDHVRKRISRDVQRWNRDFCCWIRQASWMDERRVRQYRLQQCNQSCVDAKTLTCMKNE